MHSVVIEMKSVQQYFWHYGPILFFSMSQKETENTAVCRVLQMSELIFILHYRKIFFIREQFLESYENFQ